MGVGYFFLAELVYSYPSHIHWIFEKNNEVVGEFSSYLSLMTIVPAT